MLITVDAFCQAKVQTPKPTPYDTIIRFGNRKIPVIKLTLGSTTVTYALPAKPDSIIRLEKKEIEKIVYKNGNIIVLNKEIATEIKNDQWQAIIVTKDKSQVQGLYVRGSFRVRSSPNTMDKRKTEEGAIVKLQKKAAAVKATVVLITNEEYQEEYGSTRRNYYVEGDAYGTEPLETGTDVVDPKNKDNKSKNTKSKTKK
jgi:co-chaperonin GroES (HSP10)